MNKRKQYKTSFRKRLREKPIWLSMLCLFFILIAAIGISIMIWDTHLYTRTPQKITGTLNAVETVTDQRYVLNGLRTSRREILYIDDTAYTILGIANRDFDETAFEAAVAPGNKVTVYAVGSDVILGVETADGKEYLSLAASQNRIVQNNVIGLILCSLIVAVSVFAWIRFDGRGYRADKANHQIGGPPHPLRNEKGIWKFMFYPQWQYAKAESFLEHMEQQGYRLIAIRFFWFFKFKEVTPSEARYIFCYSFPLDFQPIHRKILTEIRGKHSGEQISGQGAFEPIVFRIGNANADLNALRQSRETYLKRALRFKLLIASLFFLPTAILFFTGCLNAFALREILLLTVAAVAFFVFLYNLIGLIVLSHNSGTKTD